MRAMRTSPDVSRTLPSTVSSRPTIATIMLATDLGPASGEATAVALELASRLGARLVVMNGLDTRRIGRTGAHQRLDQARAEREQLLLQVVQCAHAQGIVAQFLVWPGPAATAVREAVASESADLLVVGSHGRDRAGRLILGSVSDALMRTAPCPVVVARPRTNVPNGPVGPA
jgi:nucleotide-binding universal stress UspA family protein